MSEMVERVAKAISKSEIQDEEGWEAFLPEARAAIEAMRDPTEDMIIPGYDALMEWDSRTGEDNGIADIFNAMINAALSPKDDAGER